MKPRGIFRFQLLLANITWSARYNIPKNDRYSDSSTDWILVRFYFLEDHDIRLTDDQIDTHHTNMCFRKFTLPHSVY